MRSDGGAVTCRAAPTTVDCPAGRRTVDHSSNSDDVAGGRWPVPSRGCERSRRDSFDPASPTSVTVRLRHASSRPFVRWVGAGRGFRVPIATYLDEDLPLLGVHLLSRCPHDADDGRGFTAVVRPWRRSTGQNFGTVGMVLPVFERRDAAGSLGWEGGGQPAFALTRRLSRAERKWTAEGAAHKFRQKGGRRDAGQPEQARPKSRTMDRSDGSSNQDEAASRLLFRRGERISGRS